MAVGGAAPQFEHLGAGMMGEYGGVVEQDLHDGAQAEAHLVQLAQALGKQRPVAFHPFAQQAQEIEGDLGEG